MQASDTFTLELLAIHVPRLAHGYIVGCSGCLAGWLPGVGSGYYEFLSHLAEVSKRQATKFSPSDAEFLHRMAISITGGSDDQTGSNAGNQSSLLPYGEDVLHSEHQTRFRFR